MTFAEKLELVKHDPRVREYLRTRNQWAFTFKPRPDDPANFDQQESFIINRDPVSFLVGGNAAGCLGAEQPIYDPVADESKPVSEIGGAFHVLAINQQSGEVEVAEAMRPEIVGTADLHRVTLSNGHEFVATLGHRVLSASRSWIPLSDLAYEPDGRLLSWTMAPCPSSSRLCESRCLQTPPDCLDGYLLGCRQCGGPLRSVPGIGLAFPPSPSGAGVYSRPLSSAGGLLAQSQARSRHQSECHPSSCHCVPEGHQFCASQTSRAWQLYSQSFGQGSSAVQGALASIPATLDWIDGRLFLGESAHPVRTIDACDRRATETFDLLPAWLTSGECDDLRIVSIEYLRRDHYWDFTVFRHHNYWMAGAFHHNTTTAAAAKCAKFLLQDQPPPRKNTPFWIISNTYEQTCDVCWQEKLVGNGFIPECEYDLNQISYHNVRKGWPSRVPLKPWPTDRGGHPNKNWQLEFKSFEQGREAMQAKSIGGFWFSEQFPLEIFLEVLRGCREYMFPGGQFSEFTPIDPELSVWVEELEENRPEGWAFYRANTRSNKGNLAEGWFEQFFGTVSDEMQGTRMTGELATFEGSIYPSFVREMHVVDESQISPPPGAWHFMGTDWGSSEEHPHTTVFGYRDGVGDWVVYDEYWSIDQRMIMVDHANEIIDMAAKWGWPIETVDDASEAARQRAAELSRIGRRIAIEQNLMYGNNFADPSRPGEINTFCQCGIPTVSAMNSVYNGIQHVRDLLKVRESTGMPRLFISSRCKHLIAEMRKYRWKQKPKMKKGSSLTPTVVRPEPLKKDDDTVDGMRYMLFSADSGSGDTPSRVQNFTEQKTTRTIQLRREASRSIQVARKDGLLR